MKEIKAECNVCGKRYRLRKPHKVIADFFEIYCETCSHRMVFSAIRIIELINNDKNRTLVV